MRRKSFTLVEILVAIAIITIMFCLLLFVIQKVRRSADNATCINNLRNLTHDFIISYDINHVYASPWTKKLPAKCLFAMYPTYDTEEEKRKFAPPWGCNITYGCNAHIVGKRHKNRNLSATVCFSDSAYPFNGSLTGTGWIGFYIRTGHYRHVNNTMNVSYLDGRVTVISGEGKETGGPGDTLIAYTGME